MRGTFFTLVLAILALALAACGGAATPEPAAAPTTIVVDMHDIYYGDNNDNVTNPPLWRVGSGAEVTVRMENMGFLEHNWAILKAGEEIPNPFDETEHGDRILFSAGAVAAGENSEASFIAPEPGEYTVVCTVPGHAVVMQGRLIVEA